MAKIGGDIELKERQHVEQENEEAQREEETSFIRDDGFKNDFERLRNDFNRFPGRYDFNMEHDGKDGYKITFPEEGEDDPYDRDRIREEIREKINYVGLRRVFERLIPDHNFRGSRLPSYDFLKDNMFLENIDIRFNKKGRIIGLSYRTPSSRRPFNIIGKQPGTNPNRLKFSVNTNPKDNMQEAVHAFKEEFTRLKEEYENTPSEMTQELVESVFETDGGSDGGSIISDEQIWEEQQIIGRTRRATFLTMEEDMGEYRNRILDTIKDAEGDPFPETEDGTSFYDHAVYITDFISNMDWYEDEAWSVPQRRPGNEVFEKELDIIERARKDVIERTKKAISGNQIMVYETLKQYLDHKEVSLKSYFDKKIYEPKLIRLYKRFLRTKTGKLLRYKVLSWLQKKFPKAMVGAIVGVIATAFGVYNVVEEMAGDALDEAKDVVEKIDKKIKEVVKDQKKMIDKAVGKLDKKLQEAVEKQGGAIKDALDGLRKSLGPTSDGLKFLLDHILLIIFGFASLLILIIILLLYRRKKRRYSRGPRVKVKYEHESSDDD